MDAGHLALFIPIVAIVMALGKNIVQSILGTFERVHMARLQAGKSAGLSDEALIQLRQEIAVLRDTSTQHAISLQHSMERLEQRVDFIERKTSATVEPVVPINTPAELQQVGERI